MKGSKSKHYCACNPRSKPDREEAKWYCYRHRRHLCDDCIYDELNQRHISCLVGTYEDFIKSKPSAHSSYFSNKCPLCNATLPDDDARAVVRLNCACVFHTNCLTQYLLSNASNNAPCPKCNVLITQKSSQRSNLSESVDRFLRSVSRQRLWNKPKNITASSHTHTHSADASIAASSASNTQMNHIQEPTQTAPEVPSSATATVAATTAITSTPDIPRQVGHIAVDMTRHRAVKSSLNKDGNKDDDKYHKPVKRTRKGVGKYSKMGSLKKWCNTRKTLVLILLCLALAAQICFMYMVFVRKNVDQNQNADINDNGNMKTDQQIRAQQGKIEGMIHNLPGNLKDEILGNKLKFDNLQKRKID